MDIFAKHHFYGFILRFVLAKPIGGHYQFNEQLCFYSPVNVIPQEASNPLASDTTLGFHPNDSDTECM